MASNNLGLYKDVVTCMKKVGGPAHFLGLVGLLGYISIRPVEAGLKAIYHHTNKKGKKDCKNEQPITIVKQGTDERGLVLKPGDKIRVLQEIENDILLIEIIGNDDNPYVVSANFLSMVSDFCIT